MSHVIASPPATPKNTAIHQVNLCEHLFVCQQSFSLNFFSYCCKIKLSIYIFYIFIPLFSLIFNLNMFLLFMVNEYNRMELKVYCVGHGNKCCDKSLVVLNWNFFRGQIWVNSCLFVCLKDLWSMQLLKAAIFLLLLSVFCCCCCCCCWPQFLLEWY